MKTDVFDKSGKKVESIELEEMVFDAKPNTALVSQYLRVFSINQYQGTSSAKTRGEVSGGGKKPWRQKGTGRARHGSIRSPIWRHGGVVHGPRPGKKYLTIPKKMRRLALVSILSDKFKNGRIKVLDGIEIKKPNTKSVFSILENLKLEGSVLFVLSEKDPNVLKSVSNLKNVKVALSDNLNGYDLLSAKNIVFIKDAVLKVQGKYK